MKNISTNKLLLIFFLILVALFCIVPDKKVDTIGNFFAKIITPLAYPLSVVIGSLMSVAMINKVIDIKKKK